MYLNILPQNGKIVKINNYCFVLRACTPTTPVTIIVTPKITRAVICSSRNTTPAITETTVVIFENTVVFATGKCVFAKLSSKNAATDETIPR